MRKLAVAADTTSFVRTGTTIVIGLLGLFLVHRALGRGFGGQCDAGTPQRMQRKQESLNDNSADDPTLIFGLGPAKQVDRIEVTWPSGTVQTLENPKSEQTVVIEEAL